MLKFIGIAGVLLFVGVCNDTASLAQIATYATLGFALMIISMLLSKHIYHLEFIAPNGRMKTVRVKNLLGKLIAIHKYTKLGYTFQAEWERA